jgi:4-hydroxybenzoate polyprenyltransferase
MSTRSRVVAYATLPHFTPLATVVAATGMLAWIVGGSSLTGSQLGRLVLAMLGGQLVVGIANELVDSETDRLTKPSKPIPAGLVSRRGAVFFGAVGLALMLSAGSSFGALSFLLLFIGTGAGVAYSLWFKRSTFAWLPYLIALPLLPIWVAISLDRFEPALLLLYPLGAFAVLGVQLAQSIPDIEADRASGIDSLTTRLGETRSLWLCWASLLGSLALAIAGMEIHEDWRSPMELAGLAVLALIGLNIALYCWNRRIGVMAAFPCAAASTALLGLAWLASIYR